MCFLLCEMGIPPAALLALQVYLRRHWNIASGSVLSIGIMMQMTGIIVVTGCRHQSVRGVGQRRAPAWCLRLPRSLHLPLPSLRRLIFSTWFCPIRGLRSTWNPWRTQVMVSGTCSGTDFVELFWPAGSSALCSCAWTFMQWLGCLFCYSRSTLCLRPSPGEVGTGNHLAFLLSFFFVVE